MGFQPTDPLRGPRPADTRSARRSTSVSPGRCHRIEAGGQPDEPTRAVLKLASVGGDGCGLDALLRTLDLGRVMGLRHVVIGPSPRRVARLVRGLVADLPGLQMTGVAAGRGGVLRVVGDGHRPTLPFHDANVVWAATEVTADLPWPEVAAVSHRAAVLAVEGLLDLPQVRRWWDRRIGLRRVDARCGAGTGRVLDADRLLPTLIADPTWHP